MSLEIYPKKGSERMVARPGVPRLVISDNAHSIKKASMNIVYKQSENTQNCKRNEITKTNLILEIDSTQF
jgi:hypothetical protein